MMVRGVRGATTVEANSVEAVLAAIELLRAASSWTELGFGRFSLHFIRTKDQQEVDFLLVEDGRPMLLVDAALELLDGDTAEDRRQNGAPGEPGPRRDIVLLNAAAAFIASGKAENFSDGVSLAAQSIDAGNAMKKLERLVEFTNSTSAGMVPLD